MNSMPVNDELLFKRLQTFVIIPISFYIANAMLFFNEYNIRWIGL